MLKIVSIVLLVILTAIPRFFYPKIKTKLVEEIKIPRTLISSNRATVTTYHRLKTPGFIMITSYVTIAAVAVFWAFSLFYQSAGHSAIGTVYWKLFGITLALTIGLSLGSWFRYVFKQAIYPGVKADDRALQGWKAKYYATLRQNVKRIFLPLIIDAVIVAVIFSIVGAVNDF
jgi:hypothetical protein